MRIVGRGAVAILATTAREYINNADDFRSMTISFGDRLASLVEALFFEVLSLAERGL